MKIEYEATFRNINKDKIKERLKSVGAKIIRPEFMQKRVTFNFPAGHEINGGWLRVRDEGDKITMSIKIVDGKKITDQKEILLKIDNFEMGVKFFSQIGCQKKSYQETKREIWELDGVEIMIDEWPFLEPFVEVEGNSEVEVRAASEKIGFNWDEALFCAVGALYKMKYGVSLDEINNKTPEIVFEGKNPFINN